MIKYIYFWIYYKRMVQNTLIGNYANEVITDLF